MKVNQIGTLTETLDAIELAKESRLHRRHLATARARPRTRPSRTSRWPPTRARSRPAPSRTDRVAKYNQLLRIEEELGAGARYAGKNALKASAGVKSLRIRHPSNDDGYECEGMIALAKAVDPLGEVWVVAPEMEQSGRVHAISLHRPLRIRSCRNAGSRWTGRPHGLRVPGH